MPKMLLDPTLAQGLGTLSSAHISLHIKTLNIKMKLGSKPVSRCSSNNKEHSHCSPHGKELGRSSPTLSRCSPHGSSHHNRIINQDRKIRAEGG